MGEQVFSSVNTMWVLIAAALVFFMQAGFAMVETGFTRAKNAGNIIMKNLMDFSIGTPAYWLIGFGIMFAGSGTLFGGIDFMVKGDYSAVTPAGIPLFAFLIFQTVFCATAATIVSGAMAERTKFSSYCVYSLIISAVIYPISGHWIWGGGWLAQLGFHDFAGSTAVHMVGGIASLIGAKIVGPRIGKYSQSGESRAIPGHSLTLGALGVFILWFCWFGFNGGSTVSMEGENIVSAGNIFVTTNLSAATAATVTMIITWLRYKKPDVSMTLNGALAGLVAITAGCDVVSPSGAFLIGIIAAFVIVFGIEFVDKVLKIDDPVGAVGVHGFSGALGTLLTGVLALDGGLAYGGGWKMLGIQALGVVSVIAWVTVTMSIVFTVIKKTMGLRVSHVEEIAGLDITEHNISSSYADFMVFPAGFSHDEFKESHNTDDNVPINTAIPVVNNSKPGAKMTKITIITNQNKLTALHNALDRIGITGLTVTNVLGHGMQKGHTEYYRGAPVNIKLLPKVQIDIVVCKIPPQTVIDTVKKVLYTGRVGDGKMFISDIENVVKVRTGEQGYDALQDNE
ncbi:MAG: ammonium transporter [Spirochaetes bacterium]|nr:ammonium transporter [Spirochaetota bacterium]